VLFKHHEGNRRIARRGRGSPVVGHVAGVPETISWTGKRYLVFHLREVPTTVFHLRMGRTTPILYDGDRVEIVCASVKNATALVQSLRVTDDFDLVRRQDHEPGFPI
jgi:hypothetical protein